MLPMTFCIVHMLSILFTLPVKTLEIARAWLQAEEEAALVLKKNLSDEGTEDHG